MNKDLTPFVREFAALSQTGLFKYMLEKRKENTHKQIDELIKAAIVSDDAHVRAIATALVNDGAIWAFFRDMADALGEKEGRHVEVEANKQHRDYVVPEFASDFMPSYTP